MAKAEVELLCKLAMEFAQEQKRCYGGFYVHGFALYAADKLKGKLEFLTQSQARYVLNKLVDAGKLLASGTPGALYRHYRLP